MIRNYCLTFCGTRQRKMVWKVSFTGRMRRHKGELWILTQGWCLVTGEWACSARLPPSHHEEGTNEGFIHDFSFYYLKISTYGKGMVLLPIHRRTQLVWTQKVYFLINFSYKKITKVPSSTQFTYPFNLYRHQERFPAFQKPFFGPSKNYSFLEWTLSRISFAHFCNIHCVFFSAWLLSVINMFCCVSIQLAHGWSQL